MKEKHDDRFAMVGLNATIISILIAIVSAYVLYVSESLHSAELRALSEADKINEVFFARSAYFPPTGFEPFAQDVNQSINYVRSKLFLSKVEEKQISVINEPKTTADIDELWRYLHFLVNPYWPYGKSDADHDLGNNKFIPSVAANRGEEILRMLNILGHCYLFPASPMESRASFYVKFPQRMYFKNMQELSGWLDGVDHFVRGYNEMRAVTTLMPQGNWMKELQKRDEKLIAIWESSQLLLTKGHLAPSFLSENFQTTADKVSEIVYRTHHEVNRFEKLMDRYLPRWVIVILLLILLCLFVFGVVAPILNNQLSDLYYKKIPLCTYVIIFIVLSVWLVLKMH